MSDSDHPGFNSTFFQRTWRLFGISFKSGNSKSTAVFVFLVLLSLILQIVIYAVGLVPSKFFEVLGSKNAVGFRNLSIYALVLIVLNALMKSCVAYLCSLLYMNWRRNLTIKVHQDYFKNLNYYQYNVFDKSLDNIDQRITRDIDQFAREWSTLMSKLVVLPFTIVYYSYKCFVDTTWIGPVSIYIFFVCGTVVNKFIMTPIVGLNVKQEIREGDFRYQHLQVRDNSESMAFFHAADLERSKSNRLLQDLLKTVLKLVNHSFWLNLSVNIFDYIGSILCYLVIGVAIFSGMYDQLAPEELSALISRTSFVCMYLIYCFSQLIDMSSTIADLSAHTHRLAQFFETLDKQPFKYLDTQSGHFAAVDMYSADKSQLLKSPSPTPSQTSSENESFRKEEIVMNECGDESDLFMCVNDVTLYAPGSSNLLIADLTLNICKNENLLVTGNTGAGKTSLLRYLAGLWPAETGNVKRFLQFGAHGVMYLPQKPIVTQGTLKDQILYPMRKPYDNLDTRETLARINHVIEIVGLTSVVEKCGLDDRTELNWRNILSPGEIQRLSFARLFYHHPQLAILDESTSGVSIAIEDQLYNICKQWGITVVTVAHQTNSRKFHDVELHISGDGTWTKSIINQDAKK